MGRLNKQNDDVQLFQNNKATSRKKGFLPLNESVYIHVSQIRSVDLEALQIEIDPELDRSMRRNLRGDDVIEKLQRCRKEDSNIFDIDKAFSEEIRAIIER